MTGDPFSKLLGYAFRLLSIRERSEEELSRRLKDRGYGTETVDRVMSYLRDKGLVDDSRFARAWIMSRASYMPKGVYAIRDELAKKGIKDKIIDGAFEDPETEYDEYRVAKALVDKRIELLKDKSGLKRKKNIYNYLARRGFSFEVINDLVDAL